MMANCVIILTLSGVILRSRDTNSDENAVTNETDNPIVNETDNLLVTPNAEQMPSTATKIWLPLQSCVVR